MSRCAAADGIGNIFQSQHHWSTVMRTRHHISLKKPVGGPFYSSSDLIFSRSAFRFGPILSGWTRQRCCLSASIRANFSWQTEQRKGALTTSSADLRRQRPTPQKTIILSSRMQSTTWIAPGQLLSRDVISILGKVSVAARGKGRFFTLVRSRCRCIG